MNKNQMILEALNHAIDSIEEANIDDPALMASPLGVIADDVNAAISDAEKKLIRAKVLLEALIAADKAGE